MSITHNLPDLVGRRTNRVDSSDAFGSGYHEIYSYDGRSELLTAKRYANTNSTDTASPVTGRGFTYAYDNIGNRTNYQVDANTATTNAAESFTSDDDGNMTADGTWLYDYDAENRLTARYPANHSVNKISFSYDHMNRYVRRRGCAWNGLFVLVMFCVVGCERSIRRNSESPKNSQSPEPMLSLRPLGPPNARRFLATLKNTTSIPIVVDKELVIGWDITCTTESRNDADLEEVAPRSVPPASSPYWRGRFVSLPTGGELTREFDLTRGLMVFQVARSMSVSAGRMRHRTYGYEGLCRLTKTDSDHLTRIEFSPVNWKESDWQTEAINEYTGLAPESINLFSDSIQAALTTHR